MKIKIKSLDNFNQNYEKLFELEKVLEQEKKKNIIIMMNMETAKLLIKVIPLKFTDMVKSILDRFFKVIKIRHLLILQNSFEENTKFSQKKFKKKMEK